MNSAISSQSFNGLGGLEVMVRSCSQHLAWTQLRVISECHFIVIILVFFMQTDVIKEKGYSV